VREQAVFAMSQLPEERAVDALLRVLRETSRPEVRRQALFWLANSDDPRALDEIERLLAE
jgi:HEAT repeat protein